MVKSEKPTSPPPQKKSAATPGGSTEDPAPTTEAGESRGKTPEGEICEVRTSLKRKAEEAGLPEGPSRSAGTPGICEDPAEAIARFRGMLSERDVLSNRSLPGERCRNEVEEYLLMAWCRFQEVRAAAARKEEELAKGEDTLRATEQRCSVASRANLELKKEGGLLRAEISKLEGTLSAEVQKRKEEEERSSKLAAREEELERQVEELKQINRYVRLRTEILTRGELYEEYKRGAHESWDLEGGIKTKEETLQLMQERGEFVEEVEDAPSSPVQTPAAEASQGEPAPVPSEPQEESEKAPSESPAPADE